MKKFLLLTLTLAALLALSACRSETQNRVRRNIQDFTGQRMYISLYSLGGTVIYQGTVDGKVTRASGALSGSNEAASGTYIFWYDDRGRYHQTDLPYLLTNFDQNESQ